MKKIIIAAVILACCLWANAEEKVIAYAQLPQSAQDFANANFKDKKLASALMDTTLLSMITEDYKVIYTDGTMLEFDSNGNWKEISAKTSAVPVDLIPEKILKYIKENFGGARVIVLEKDDDGYKVELATKQELKFNNNYIFIELD